MRRANGPPAKGLAEHNHHMRDEHKESRDGVGAGGQGLSEEEESRINNNEYSENVRRLPPVEAVENQVVLQRQQQQPPQGPLVQWERFLPLRSLKVLLVENDDSTRHVVSALLRNCSYEVVAVANGLEAWRIVEDQTNRIDLVLTEVVMPCLTGVGLLSLIKSHKTCKNIPVIMMSSNDSMGIVFKCLSKGAVDFLVKPIRKNELKNLWQHVWRKCHSSSGSASESGIRTQKSTKSKGVESSDNNSGSNEDEYGSIGLNAKDGSDNGSGTQTSWSKRVVEVDSPQPMSPCEQFADPPDSTCAQVVHSNPEAFSNNWVPRTECRREDDELDSCYVMGKDLEIGVPRNTDLQLDNPSKSKAKFFDLNSKKDGGDKLGKGRVDLNGDDVSNVERNKGAVDLLGGITNNNCNNTQTKTKCVANEVTNELSNKISNNVKDKVAICDTKQLPSLELSLKRQRDTGSTGQERNVLRHSDLSAFSRYNTSSNTNQTGNVGSCSPLDNSLEAAKTDSVRNLQSNGTPNQRSNGSSNDDMGSTTNNVVTKPEIFTDKQQIPKSTVNAHPCSAFQPVLQQTHISTTLQPEEANAETSKVQVQHHHHHYHHHHHHVHNMQQQEKVGSASNCGPSNVMNGSMEGNAANYSLNGITLGNGGENDGSGSGSGGGAMGEGGMNMGSDNGGNGGGATAKCGGDDGSGSGSGSRSGVDQNRLAQREAALNKFRQKRKDRCFEKKVRYQSRKRLAEQKPRVRGQFVRKTNDENIKKDTES